MATDFIVIAEKSFQFHLITQFEKRNELIIIPPSLDNIDLKKHQLTLFIDQESDLKLLKSIKPILLSNLKHNYLPQSTLFFWLKMIITLSLGLLLFIATSILIRDPLPLLDEALITFTSAFYFYFFLGDALILKLLPDFIIQKELNFVNQIEIKTSQTNMRLNLIFREFYEKFENQSFVELEAVSYLTDLLIVFDKNECSEIRLLLSAINEKYHFSRLKLNTKKLEKTMKKSSLSRARFTFYYLLDQILKKNQNIS